MSVTLFISDLHLDESRPAVTHLFLQTLQQYAGKIDALYILGDLFEAWIGDDAIPQDHPLLAALKQFCAITPTYFVHGNRDFLIGEQFAAATGCTLLDEHTVVDLYGTPTLLLHGDTLCIDDTAYMQFRNMVRNPAWQTDFLAKPIAERIAIAKAARQESQSQNSQKSEEIMDVNYDEVLKTFARYDVTHMIHGHTHRPNVHHYSVDQNELTRIVLGDWYDQGSVLLVSPEGFDLKEIPAQ